MKLIRQKFILKDYKEFDVEKREIFLLQRSDCDLLLDKFFNIVDGAIEDKINFPILRLADGEFQFLLGKNEFNLRKPMHKLFIHLLMQFLESFTKKEFVAKSRTYSSGVYSQSDMKSVKNKYLECLKYISQAGVLAIYTVIKPGFFSEQYLPKLFKYFKKNNISVNTNNFYPFYFVYILLTNSKFSKIYENRHIHLITSFDLDRKSKIEATLLSLGAKKVTWTEISRDKSLFDLLDLNSIENGVDIIFVGAGVGKVNIFNQLKNFPATIIDAGYIFETWQDHSLINERDYCKIH
tara:strand:- start:3829 stop:4710 length:882 start_codon:yes stop_codon:yes gene_type:complete